MKNLLCKLQHGWSYQSTGETRYSKGGIFAGSVELRTRECRRCHKTEEVFRFRSMPRMMTGWTRYPKGSEGEIVRTAIHIDFLPMAELVEWREHRSMKARRTHYVIEQVSE